MEKANNKIGFLSLKPDEFSIIYPVVIKNAERHFQASACLANAKDYSNAVSHLILGSEELIKAFFLMLECKGIRVRGAKGYHRIYFNHAARHAFMKEFFSVWLGFSHIITINKKRKSEGLAWYIAQVLKALSIGITSGIANYEWWSNADSLKQKCFYVDYDNGIIAPETIDGAQYEHAFKHVSIFRNEFESWRKEFEEAEPHELANFADTLEEAGFRELLSETIKRAQTGLG